LGDFLNGSESGIMVSMCYANHTRLYRDMNLQSCHVPDEEGATPRAAASLFHISPDGE